MAADRGGGESEGTGHEAELGAAMVVAGVQGTERRDGTGAGDNGSREDWAGVQCG